MGIIRRWVILCTLPLLIVAGLTATVTGSASAAPAQRAHFTSRTPVQLNYACARKRSGLLRYVTSTSKCFRSEEPVTIAQGPHYVCVRRGDLAYLVKSPASCPVPRNKALLTLPPSSAPVYFCAWRVFGKLSYTTDPRKCCPVFQFPVVVPVPHTAPVLANIETSALAYTAGGPPAPVTSTLTVSSADATTLAGATVKISAGLVAAADSLGFTGQNGITGSYDASTGTLTLTGTASLASYQTALRSVTYADSSANAATSTRTISFQVNDGSAAGNLSNTVSRAVSISPAAPPVANNDTVTTGKNTAIDINVLSNDTDPAGKPLAVNSVDTAGTKGNVTINADGTIHYDPNGQFTSLTSGQSATDTFTYTATDGTQVSNAATVTVTINGVSDKPVIAGVETTALSYQAQSPPVAITSTLTIADDDDATLSGATVTITGGLDAAGDSLGFTNQNGITGSYASTGVLTLSGSAPLADYQAALRSVAFATTDASASPAARTVSFTVTDSVGATSNAATRTIDVTAAPQAPTAVNQSYTAVGNTPLGVGTTPAGPAATVSGSLLNGDTDPDPTATLSVTANSTPAHGSVTVHPDGTFSYLPDAGFSGTDTFTYTIAGSNAPARTATATVTITVGPLVWYVSNTAAAGNGEAGTPFATLAAAGAAAGANSIIFLYQGSGSYTGGLVMKSGQSLFGQPHGLTVDGYSLVAAGGSDPTITNSGGDGIDLASGADVENVTVSGASANGISGTNVTGTITLTRVTSTASGISNAIITDASGTLVLNVDHSTFSANAASPGGEYGLDVNANGSTAATVSVTNSTFTSNASIDFEFATGLGATGTNSVTFNGNTVTGGGGVEFGPFGADATAITADSNNIQDPSVEGIGVDNVNSSDTGGSVSGTISGNVVGSPGAANSGGGFGIGIGAEGGFTDTLTISNNTLSQYQNDAGINFIGREGSPVMNLTITGNTISSPGSFGSWGILGTAGALATDNPTVCAAITGNAIKGSAAAGQGGADIETDQFDGTFRLPGYAGAATDDSAVAAFLQGNNTANGTPSALASGTFSGASC